MNPRFPILVAAVVLVCASPALAQTWTAVGPPSNPSVHALLPDPGTPAIIYAGTASGVFVTTDAGATWSAANGGLTSSTVTSLAGYQPPTPPATPPLPPLIYAGTQGGGVFVSATRAGSWTASSTGMTNLQVNALAVSASGAALYAATNGGVFRSTDGAGHWVPVGGAPGNVAIVSLAMDPENASVLFAGGSFGTIYRSTDGGSTWAPVYTAANSQISSLAVDPGNSSDVYAASASTLPVIPPPTLTPGSFLKSVDGGITWAVSSNGLPSVAVTSITVDPRASARVYVTNGQGIYVTRNFGATWDAINDGLTSLDVRAFTLALTSPATLYAGTFSQGVFKATADTVGVCAPGPTSLCLQASRFLLQVAWSVPDQGTSGSGQAIPLSTDTGAFWFFSSTNYELMIKVLDGTSVNGHFWVFYGALSNVQYTITVTDTRTGAIKVYTNPFGTLASVADVLAF
jgi:photosystem II stability/assembly factor-like uncharacterized protein